MSNVSKIISAVETAKSRLGDLVIDVIYREPLITSYNPTTGSSESDILAYQIQAVQDSFDITEVDGSLVRWDDIKLLVFSNEIDVSIDGTIDLLGTNYSIINVVPVYAGNTLVLRMLQLRR